MSAFSIQIESFPLIKTILSGDFDFGSPVYGAGNKQKVTDRIQKLSPQDQKRLHDEFAFLLGRLQQHNDLVPNYDLKEKGLAVLLLVDAPVSTEEKQEKPKGVFGKLSSFTKLIGKPEKLAISAEAVVQKLSELREKLTKPTYPKYEGGLGLCAYTAPADLKGIIAATEAALQPGSSTEQSDLQVVENAASQIQAIKQKIDLALKESTPDKLFQMQLDLVGFKTFMNSLPYSLAELRIQCLLVMGVMEKMCSFGSARNVALFMQDNSIVCSLPYKPSYDLLLKATAVDAPYNDKSNWMKQFMVPYAASRFQELEAYVGQLKGGLEEEVTQKRENASLIQSKIADAKKAEQLRSADDQIRAVLMGRDRIGSHHQQLLSIKGILDIITTQKAMGLESLKQCLALAISQVKTQGLNDVEDFGWYVGWLDSIVNHRFDFSEAKEAYVDLSHLNDSHVELRRKIEELNGNWMMYLTQVEANMLALIGNLVASTSVYIDQQLYWNGKKLDAEQKRLEYVQRCRMCVDKGLELPAMPSQEEDYKPVSVQPEPTQLYPSRVPSNIPVSDSNGTSFSDRGTLDTIASAISKNITNEIAVKPLFDSIKTHALKDEVYKQFYFLMLGKQCIKQGHDSWGGMVFHGEGNWNELVHATSTIQMNLYRLQAIRAVVNGTERDRL